jgi:hypothetical protein
VVDREIEWDRASNGESYKCGRIPMDSLITAAARTLATGDPVGALKRVALRDDAPALALRGIAIAQLGDLVRAKTLLRSAARAFGPKEAVAPATCVVTEAERRLAEVDRAPFPPASKAAHELVIVGIAMRRLQSEGGARSTRSGRARSGPRPYPGADSGGCKRIPSS